MKILIFQDVNKKMLISQKNAAVNFVRNFITKALVNSAMNDGRTVFRPHFWPQNGHLIKHSELFQSKHSIFGSICT